MKRNRLLLSTLMAAGAFALTTEAYGGPSVVLTPAASSKIGKNQVQLINRSLESKQQTEQPSAADTPAPSGNSSPSSSSGNSSASSSSGNSSASSSGGSSTPSTPVVQGTLKTVTLTNQSSQPLGNITITFSGTNASDFSQMNNCGNSLAGGGSCTITVVFLPKSSGPKSAIMEVTSTGGGQAVYLTGTGT